MAVLAACGASDDGDVGAVAGRNVTTATSDEATTTTATDETTTSTTTTTLPDGGGLAAGPEYHPVGASGAGCTPGEVDQLPDGWWAGEIVAIDGATMDFDLVCFFAGAAGGVAAAEDGVEFTNDYHVRNNNPRTFAVTFPGADGPATCVGGDIEPFPCTVADVLRHYPGSGETGVVGGREVIAFPYVWVHIGGGVPDYLYVQFTP